jgi:hypothetical protein
MAANTQVSESAVDELLFQNDAVSLCLLVNRRHRSMRVIDFRAGVTPAKRNFVIAAAKREGVEKVFTLVERDEVNTWAQLGFRREGSIPGFYKRSDAWIMGAIVSQVGPVRTAQAVDDDDIDDVDEEPSPALDDVERMLGQARKLMKDTADKAFPPIKLAPVKLLAASKAVLALDKAKRAITGFEPFGRGASRDYVVATGRGGFELAASLEMMPSFGSSLVEIAAGPKNETERLLTTSALRALSDHLASKGAVSTFSIAPADDVALSACFLAAGFRKSAVLLSHVVAGGQRHDALIWSKKLVAGES